MQFKYSLEEMRKTYFSEAENWKDMPETTAELKKACAELKELVPNEKLCNDIKDCFGVSLDKYQMQGFIRGFLYSLTKFYEEGQKDFSPENNQLTPHQMICHCETLISRVKEEEDLLSKVFLLYHDINDEVHENQINIEDMKCRLDIMSDYIAKLMTNEETLSELSADIYRAITNEAKEVTANA